MIRGLHGLFYSSDPDATREFFRDKVKLPGSDIGQGWWIFDLPEGDLGIHPVEPGAKGGGHDVSFYCDDIHGTVAAMKSRGVTFTKDVADHGYGLVTYFEAPGGITVQLYEPRYTKSTSRPKPAKAKAKSAARSAKPAKAKAKAKTAPKAKPNGRSASNGRAKPNGKATTGAKRR
jgi:catechol 2,3-dioxygenase-like lactoylglutathione lyase family enzyme